MSPVSQAVTQLTKAVNAASDSSDIRRAAAEIRQQAFDRGGTIVPAARLDQGIQAITREAFEAALSFFGRFISADKRMIFLANGRWQEKVGGKPGEAGARPPPHILESDVPGSHQRL